MNKLNNNNKIKIHFKKNIIFENKNFWKAKKVNFLFSENLNLDNGKKLNFQ